MCIAFLPERKDTYLSDILLNQLRSNDSDKAGISAISHGSGTQGLSCTGGPE